MLKAQDTETAVADLMLAMGQLVRRLRALPNSHDLPWTQMAIMGRLKRSGPMTTADLARAEAVKPQSMGSTLASMEQDGFVERRPHATDGRQVLFAITAKGQQVRRDVRVVRNEWLTAAVEKFSPEEQKTLIVAVDLLRRLGDASVD